MQTLRALKPSEFPLAEPYRVHVVKPPQGATMAQLAQSSPMQKDPVQMLRLINDLYPNKDPAAGQAGEDRRLSPISRLPIRR